MSGTDHAGLSDARSFEVLDEALAVLTAMAPTDLDVLVPSCPGWTVGDLLAHTGQIHRWVVDILEMPPGERFRFPPHEPPRGSELIAYTRAGGIAMADALRAHDLDAVIFTWIGPRPTRWWVRRQVHENVVHAWDMQGALGAATPVAADVAVDGIDELFDVFLPHRFNMAEFAGTGESMHLHATDIDGEWMIRFAPDHFEVTREHGKGDVAARATASDLLLFLWGRARPDTLETFGDPSILERYQTVAGF